VARNVGALSPVPFPGSAAVYRFKVKDRPMYLLVTSLQERDTLVASGYTLEGIAGYDSAGPQPGMVPWFRFHSWRADWRVSLASDDPDLLRQGYVLDGPFGYTWPVPPPVQEVSPAAARPAAAAGAPAPAVQAAAPPAAPAAVAADSTAPPVTPGPAHPRSAARLDANPVAAVLARAGGVDRRIPLAMLGLALAAGLALVLARVVAGGRRQPSVFR
jgi:hypothetical protein